MINSADIKIFSKDFLAFSFFVLAVGKGSSLVSTFDPRLNIVGFLIYMLCFTYLYRKVKSDSYRSSFNYVLIVYAAWLLIHTVTDGFYPLLVFLRLLSVCGAYLIVRRFGINIVSYFEKSMVVLSLLSLFFWTIANTLGNSVLLSLPHLDNPAGNSDFSLIFYAMFDTSHDGYHFMGIIRNSGFAWEPGLFASLLVVAIYCNIIRNGGKIVLKDKQLIILVVTLLSTFSTTGYISLSILVFLVLINSSRYSVAQKILSLLVFSALFSYALTLPFMQEKIEMDTDLSNNSILVNDKKLQWEEANTAQFTVGRFDGIMLDLLNIKDKPLAGYGFQRSNSYVYNSISQALLTSNGIAKPIAIYGIPLGLMLFICAFKSFRKLERAKSRDIPIMFVIILATSISYYFFENALILSMIFFEYFRDRSVKLD